VTSVSIISAEMRRLGHEASIVPQHVVGNGHGPDVHPVESRPARRDWPARALDKLMYRVSPEAWHSRDLCRSIAATVRRLIDERGLQVFEMEEAFGWPALVRRMVEIPVVVRLHGPWFLNGPLSTGHVGGRAYRSRLAAEREGILAADLVSAPSRDVLERTRDFYGLSLPRAEVVPNPAPTVPAKDRWRREESDPDLILFVGRFDRHKGGDLIIDAFARVARENPRARLCFAGEDRGLTDSGGRSRRLADYLLEKLPADTMAAGRVEWVGRQSLSYLAALRRRAGVTVCSSRYETFGYTAIEAMSQGCPLVAAGAGAVLEIVNDGVNGLLFRSDDARDLAEKILRLQGDRDLAARLGHRAGLDCEFRYNSTSVAGQMVETYRRLLDGSSS
jgi:glycosyltransferase involved in cell wall biosynthesis